MDKIIEAINRGFILDIKNNVIGIRGIPLKMSVNKKGYVVFSMRIKKITKNVLYHRFIAYHKFGDKLFEKGICVRHLNGNQLDNSWDNIAIGTHSDNMMDRPKHVRQIISKMSNRKYSEEFIQALKLERLNGKTYSQLGKEFNIGRAMLSYYLGNNCKQHEVVLK